MPTTGGVGCGHWHVHVVALLVARPRAPVYLNMYLILVGDSGIPRKSTSINMASDLVRACIGDDSAVGVVDAKVTPEQLDDLLHERTKQYGSAQFAVPYRTNRVHGWRSIQHRHAYATH